ncbi:MAG: hypothetical protein J6D03_07355 [Clostridia bacterium]|nr:hypothetical protein [Clostridia bacterium]
MEGKRLRVYNTDRTFFSKITNTITKLLIPTKVGINGVLISIKRNNLLKAYENFALKSNLEEEKKEALSKKYEDVYTLYLDAIDKNIVDSVYKKVKNNTATDFEKDALSRYYLIVHLKENDYTEYKYRKQKYLLELDYQAVLDSEKEKLIQKYKKFYCYKMENIYKGILKYYSIKLADNLTLVAKDEIYNKIFSTLEEYIVNILPLKFKDNSTELYKEIIGEYEGFEKYTVGKLDQNEIIEKKMILLGISRRLFTHSLPLMVAEQCYIKLLKDVRSLIVDTRIIKKQEKAYSLLIKLIEEYNMKLLSTKVYWDKPVLRQEYRKFWDKYKELEDSKNEDEDKYLREKEILFITNDLKQVLKNENKYFKIIKFYKNKLVELGVMKELKNSCTTYVGTYVKQRVH